MSGRGFDDRERGEEVKLRVTLVRRADGLGMAELLPCGGRAVLDARSGCDRICMDCLCVVGSVGMPPDCQEALKKQRGQ